MDVKKTDDSGTTPEENTKPHVLSWQQLVLRATGLSLIFVIVMLLITAAGVGIYAYSKFSIFSKNTGLSFSETKQLVSDGLNQEPQSTDGKTSILILGIDKVSNKPGAPPLTDTMLLVTIDYSSGKINLLSLPRDLWSEEYKTKVNALYYYGLERYPDEPERFPREVLAELTGVQPNYTVVFSLESITTLVDLLGGIDVQVPYGFVDTEFPREDVDVTTTKDPAKLYETVEFTQGTEHMTADRVTKYIRSRHSQGDTGTDLDRAARQQLVLSSLTTTMLSKEVLTNPETIAKLYNWYASELAKYISIIDAISVAHKLYPHRDTLELIPHAVSIKTAESPGALEHLPPAKTDNQWTYSIVDKESFKSEVQEKLFKK